VTSTVTDPVRVRFAPSPTGYLHIGSARTVLFNWLLARKHGGTFILRIEDTDQTRHVEDSVQKILDDLRWLGLTWDEGPEVGGDHGPYFQSQRLEIYNRHLQELLESGHAYYALEMPQQLTALRDAAKAAKQSYKYVRPNPPPTIAEGEAARAAGRPVVVRFKMPAADITVVDKILGRVTLPADQSEDFVLQKGDGYPTYHFACVVDDELMKVTHVLRGQEHLINTTKHIALQQALGFATPQYAHLSVIFNMDGTKMSKRDKEKAVKEGRRPPEIDVHDFRVAGYLPEAIVNYIALLGWSPGDDREFFNLDELTGVFGIDRVGKTNARFDREKLLSFNTTWATRLSSDRLLEAFKDYIRVSDSPMSAADDDLLREILRTCAGFRTFRQVEEKVRFLFLADDVIEYDAKAVQKVLAKNNGEGYAALSETLPRLRDLSAWTADAIEKLIHDVCEKKAVQIGAIAQPLRVAITGTTISPSIHDTLALLGQNRTLARVEKCLKGNQSLPHP
jgi:glutamyl-tRNA synthetase